MKLFNKKKKEEKTKPKKPSFFQQYTSIAFHSIGRVTRKKSYSEELGYTLKQADLLLTPEMYYALILFTGLLVIIPSGILFYIIFKIIINSSMWVLYTLGLTGLVTIASILYYPLIVKSKISNRRQLIDKELPFALSELSILASTGLTPIKMFRQIAQRDEKSVLTNEFKKIIYKTDIEGKDLITTLSETAKESPSDEFREALWDIANMVHQGGDIDIYLRDKADMTMQVKRDIQKEFIEKLGGYSEMYISLVLVTVLFLSIAVFLLDALNISQGAITSESLLLLLTYILIPVAVIVINLMVSMAYSKQG